MAERSLVVVHFNDDRILKGTTQNFLPGRPSFHLMLAGGGSPSEVSLSRLKAVFFVKDQEGKADRRDVKGFFAAPARTALGLKVAVRFQDGELLCGYSLGYSAGRDGFFLTPADQEGNNLRVYVVRSSVIRIEVGSAAEELARSVAVAPAMNARSEA